MKFALKINKLYGLGRDPSTESNQERRCEFGYQIKVKYNIYFQTHALKIDTPYHTNNKKIKGKNPRSNAVTNHVNQNGKI